MKARKVSADRCRDEATSPDGSASGGEAKPKCHPPWQRRRSSEHGAADGGMRRSVRLLGHGPITA